MKSCIINYIRRVKELGETMQSIRKQMIFYMLIALLVIFSALGIFVVRSISQIPDSIEFYNQEISNARAAEVSKELKNAKDTVNMLSKSTIDFLDSEEDLRAFLIDAAANHETFRNFTISDAEGNAWTTYGANIDISEQEQFISIMENNDPYNISQPFMSPFTIEDVPIITVAYPIIVDGENVGILNGVISLKFLDDIITDINYLRSGYAYITHQDGQFIAHPKDEVSIDNTMREYVTNYPLFENADGFLDYFNDEAIRILGFYAPIEDSPEWVFTLAVPYDDAMAPYSNVLNFIIMGFIFTLIALIIFALFYSNSIAKPIIELEKTFKAAENGNLDAKADEHYKNEIGKAAKSFNSMLTKIKTLTFMDPVTNLYNFTNFKLIFKRKIMPNEYYALMNISVDDFRRINAIGGFDSGNSALEKLSQRLKCFKTENDLLARYYGDELLFLIYGKDEESLKSKIHSINQIFNQSFNFENFRFVLTASIGVTIFKATRNEELDQRLKEANYAKHYAKKDQKTSIKYYNHMMHEALEAEKDLEDAILNGIKAKEFAMYYQPIVDTNSNKILGVESLLRWLNPKYQDVPISDVIDIAERKGYIYTLGAFVIEESFKALNALKQNTDFIFSVNISALQIEDQRFVEMVENLIQEYAINPMSIHFEITETQLMNSKVSDERFEALKDLGIKLSIDDFGTKYSSLAYFNHFPIDILKLDRQFINTIDENEKNVVITKAIIEMSQSLGIEVIAEGVETHEQLLRIKALNCKFYQGYIFSKAIAFEDLQELIERSDNA